MSSSLAMSSQNKSFLNKSEEAPDWDTIKYALKCLFARFNIDLNEVGASHRLDWKNCEAIIYHLVFIIDVSECRRKYWDIFPSRNTEEKSRFIKLTTQFIEDKQIVPDKITMHNLRVCGGESFRRLLTAMIMRAADTESKALQKRLIQPLVDVSPNSIDVNLSKLEYAELELSEKFTQFKILKQKYEDTQKKQCDIDEKKKEITEARNLGLSLTQDQLNNDLLSTDDYKALITRLEKSSARCTLAAEKILSLAKEDNYNTSSSTGGDRLKTTVSQTLKEIRARLSSAPGYLLKTHKTELVDIILQRMSYFDEKVKFIISNWEVELERAYDFLLKDPEFKHCYDEISKLVPSIEIQPMDFKKVENKEVMLSNIEQILGSIGARSKVFDDYQVIEYLKQTYPHRYK